MAGANHGARRMGWARALAASLAAIALLGGVGNAAALAQSDGENVDGNVYTSPNFGYTLEWDEDVWEVDAEGQDTYGPGRDTLELFQTDRTSYIIVEGFEDYDGDAATCLETSIEEAIAAGEDREPLEDEDGEVIEDEDDGRAFAAFSFTVSSAADNEVADRIAYVECRTLVDGESVVVFTHIGAADAYFDGDQEEALEVIDSLRLPDDGASPEAGDGGEDEDATPTADDDATAEAEDEDEDERETPDADASPTSDDDDATPEAGDDDASPAAGDAGVEGDTYTSPTYGYELEWDGDEWEVVDATSEDDVDTLVLTDGSSEATLTGVADFEGDAQTCFEAAEDAIADREGVEDVAIAETSEGEPVIFANDDGTNVYGVYTYTLDGEETAEYVDCFTLEEGESVVSLSSVFAADEDGAVQAAQDLLEGLTLPGEASVN